MENGSHKETEERNPLLWQEAHADEALYWLLCQRREITNSVGAAAKQGLPAVELQETIRQGRQRRREIDEQIHNRLLTLGYPNPEDVERKPSSEH